MKNLPAEMQISPIFAFQKNINSQSKHNQYIFGGNFFGTLPYEGRYDAQALGMFEISKNNKIKFLPQSNFASLKTEIRDLKWLKTKANESVLSVRQNNGSLLFYKKH